MRVVCLADTHERHRELEVPPGDLLIHAGDFTVQSRRRGMIADFNSWLGILPHRHKIVICGNHEYAFEAEPTLSRQLSNALLLTDEAVEVDGIRIWGSPVTPLYGGAFGLSRAEDRRRLYAGIPAGTDILITHGPPLGILDGGQGCAELLEASLRVRPRVHVFGHAHAGYGVLRRGGTTYVQCCDDRCGRSERRAGAHRRRHDDSVTMAAGASIAPALFAYLNGSHASGWVLG